MKTITFYSYKGGVGRSLALVNIASRLAEFGRKVCMLDFDLEAPGLQYKFPEIEEATVQNGIVDYIYEFANLGILPSDIKNFALPLSIPPSKTSAILIPAGNTNSKQYWKKLSSINWFDLLYKNENGLVFLLDLKEKIKSQIKPDYLLIDSRTGISEMSGIALSLLADEVVIVAANNKENLNGSRRIIDSIINSKNLISDQPPKVTFVLSRIPFTDIPGDKTKEQSLIQKIKREYLYSSTNEINIIHSDRELEENEKIKIGYEKDATTTQIARDYLNLFEQLTRNDFSAAEVDRFKNIKKSEAIFAKAITSKNHLERMELVKKALELNENNLSFYQFRAIEYYKQKNFDKAKSDVTKIIKRSPYLPAYDLLAKIYFANSQYEEARKTYEQILGLDPNSPSAILGLGNIYSKEGKFLESIKYYSKGIEILPDNPEGYNGRANSNRLLGNLEDALRDIYRALELDPNFPVALATLAEIYAAQNKLNEFYMTLERGLIANPKIIETAISIEEIYKKFLQEERFQKLLEKYNVTLPGVS